MSCRYDVLMAEEAGGNAFLAKIDGRNPLYICVIGATETAKVPGLSAAGKYPELTDYTPPADVELLLLGECRCIEGFPVTPEGIPTPALITMSALRMADIPVLVVNGGVRVQPHVPFMELNGKPGGDIREGRALEDPGRVLEKARLAGENLARVADYLVIGESVPGGTTTALGVMLAMGVNAVGRVSSSMPANPHELKYRVVMEGLRAAGVEPGALADKPLEAMEVMGDSMMPAYAGLVLGAARRVPVLLAGGTQMGAILAVLKALDKDVLGNVAVGTTRWVFNDGKSDLKGIVSQIAPVPILAADLNFAASRFPGLRAYEEGYVKEGVGAGGAAIAAMAKSRGAITGAKLLMEIERNYARLASRGLSLA